MRKFTTIILVLSVFSILSPSSSAQHLDIEWLRKINSNTSTMGFSRVISNTTTKVALGVPLAVGVAALIEKDDEMLKNAIYIGASIVVDGALTQGLKMAVNRPRPIVTYPDQINADPTLRTLSFPSGHASLAFATATSLSLKYPKWYVIVPAYAWAGSVGYSRMNLGVHYPSDVLAGALLGAGSAWATYKVNNWFWKKTGNKKLIALEAYR